jgi:hypothetical protein
MIFGLWLRKLNLKSLCKSAWFCIRYTQTPSRSWCLCSLHELFILMSFTSEIGTLTLYYYYCERNYQLENVWSGMWKCRKNARIQSCCFKGLVLKLQKLLCITVGACMPPKCLIYSDSPKDILCGSLAISCTRSQKRWRHMTRL